MCKTDMQNNYFNSLKGLELQLQIYKIPLPAIVKQVSMYMKTSLSSVSLVSFTIAKAATRSWLCSPNSLPWSLLYRVDGPYRNTQCSIRIQTNRPVHVAWSDYTPTLRTLPRGNTTNKPTESLIHFIIQILWLHLHGISLLEQSIQKILTP